VPPYRYDFAGCRCVWELPSAPAPYHAINRNRTTGNQRLSVTINDSPAGLADVWLDHDYLASIDAAPEAEPSIEEVRQALAKIPGNLSDDIRAERDARG
jgi:hypothetical protein